MKPEIVVALIGALGIGTGIWGVIDRITQYRLDKNKFLFKEKLDSFNQLSRQIMGFSLHEELPKNVFDNFAESARARLLINSDVLDKNIHQFFIDLDSLSNEKVAIPNSERGWERLQQKSLEIIKGLKDELNKTL